MHTDFNIPTCHAYKTNCQGNRMRGIFPCPCFVVNVKLGPTLSYSCKRDAFFCLYSDLFQCHHRVCQTEINKTKLIDLHVISIVLLQTKQKLLQNPSSAFKVLIIYCKVTLKRPSNIQTDLLIRTCAPSYFWSQTLSM